MLLRTVRHARAGALSAAAMLLSLSAASAGDLNAGDWSMKDGVVDAPEYGFRIDGGVSIGDMNGTAHELVYEPDGRKLSELIWTMEDIVMVGGKLEMSGSPWWTVGIEGWTNVSDDATMDDYDWFYDWTEDWTHWSHHISTDLENAQLIDAYGKLNLFRLPGFDFGAIVGYRWDKFRWVAKGGHFIYSDTENGGFRDQELDFSEGETVITYQQDFSAPYIGAGASAHLGPFTIEGKVLASWWVQADGDDHHWLRGLFFRDDFDSGEMLQVDVNGKYQITPEVALTAGYKRIDYDENTGQTRIQDTNGLHTYLVEHEDSAGIDNETEIISLGVDYAFN